MTVAITVEQAAKQLSVSKNTIRNQIIAGEIPAFYIRRCIRIKQSDLDAYIEQAQHTKLQGPKEVLSCHSTGEMEFSTLISSHQAAKELGARLELTTRGRRRKSTTK